MQDDLEQLHRTMEEIKEQGAPFYRDDFAVLQDEQTRDYLPSYSPALDRLLARYETHTNTLENVQRRQPETDEQLVWAFSDDMIEDYDGEAVFALERDARDRMRIYCTVDRFLEKFARDFVEASGPAELREEVQTTAEKAQTGFDTYFSIWDDRFENWESVLWAWYRSNPSVEEQVTELAERYDRIEETATSIAERAEWLTTRTRYFEY
ncbi:MAG: hypothetical protein SVU32_03020 [Candidatus Nanohaloarchaea archaeon]|nr:hypothetical protein [Candidatus Nanohaloarchaea archaeon]